MDIRPAAQDDIPLLSRLNAEVQRLHAEHHPEVFKPPENDAFAESFFRDIFLTKRTGSYLRLAIWRLDIGKL